MQIKDRIITVGFEDGELEGLKMQVRLNLPFSFYFAVAKMSSNGDDPDKGVEDVTELMRQFASKGLVSWNLQDAEGNPVPATEDGFLDHVDPINGGRMLRAVIAEMGNVSAPLATASDDGQPSGKGS